MKARETNVASEKLINQDFFPLFLNQDHCFNSFFLIHFYLADIIIIRLCFKETRLVK